MGEITIFTKALNRVIGGANKIGTALYPHVPTICVVGGSVAVAGGAFFACKATLRLNDIVDEHNAMMDCIVEKLNVDDNDYGELESRKDRFQTYRMTVWKTIKNYAPAIGLGALGFASIFYGFGMITKWHALSVSALAALDESFAAYRQNVINEYGEEADRFLSGDTVVSKEIDISTVDDEGNESTIKVDAVNVDDVTADDFTRILDWRSSFWVENDNMNQSRIMNISETFTRYLQARAIDYVFFNKVLTSMKYKETGIGHFYGWTSRPGCAVNIQVRRFIYAFNDEDNEQFPMMCFINEDNEQEMAEFNRIFDEDVVRRQMIEYGPNYGRAAYVLVFNVDCDENGAPHQIYTDVFGGDKFHKKDTIKYIG